MSRRDRTKAPRRNPNRRYTYRSMHREREVGLYWYAGLWRVLRPILVGVTSVIVVIGVLGMAWSKVYDEYIAPTEPGSTEEITFRVQSGQSLSRVASNLEAAGLIRSKTVFKYYCDFSGLGQKLQVGSYVFTRSMTIDDIAQQLTRGDGTPIVRNITMIPGWTIEDFAAKLVSDGVLESSDEFLSLCRSGTAYADYYYIADVLNGGTAKQRSYVLEGYLAADTYEVYTDATADDIIRKLLSQTDSLFPTDATDRAAELGYSLDEILTLASMIEKEAGEEDFARVSAVFHNRLKKKMKLESDVTIHYITGVRKMNLTSSDVSVSSPYNTYQNAGLPPGPICSPSKAAITAALYPDETYLADGYLYFCACEPDSGKLYFSKTLKEHERAVAVYAPLWEAYDRERGIE